jgi:hypothetical protein
MAVLAGAVSVAHAGRGRPGLCAPATNERPAYLAVVSAYPAELAPIAGAAEIEKTVQIDTLTYYVARLAGVRVLLGLTGIGIRNATDTARHLLARHDVAGLIMSGTAGTRDRPRHRGRSTPSFRRKTARPPSHRRIAATSRARGAGRSTPRSAPRGQ